MERISVAGIGRLGLCVATCFAYKGCCVIGVDADRRRIELANRGIVNNFEPRLSEMLQASKDRLIATHDYHHAVKNTDVTFIVVNTPSNEVGGYSLEHVEASCAEIGKVLREKHGFHLVVLTSTVLPGSTEGVVKPLLEKTSGKKCGVHFGLCYNPEFIAMGSVLHDFLNPDLVLIGESDKYSGELLSKMYEKVCDNTPRIVRMSIINAEITKIAINSYVTTKISFANTIAQIAERVRGADVDTITSAMGLDHRIGPYYLKGGLGYGGPCFPRDNIAFSYFARKVGTEAKLASVADEVNRDQAKRIGEVLAKRVKRGTKVAVLGLTYKPNTDIVECSQAIDIIRALLREGAAITVYDPKGMNNARRVLDDKVRYASSVRECVKEAEVCVIATPWSEFSKLDPEDFGNPTEGFFILDCWRLLDQAKFSKVTEYVSLGRGTNNKSLQLETAEN